jgi:hypothetical protein
VRVPAAAAAAWGGGLGRGAGQRRRLQQGCNASLGERVCVWRGRRLAIPAAAAWPGAGWMGSRRPPSAAAPEVPSRRRPLPHPTAPVLPPARLPAGSFITFEEEAAVQRVFAAGPMQQLAGKLVEVKSATPKGSGPQGRVGAPAPGATAAPGGGPSAALPPPPAPASGGGRGGGGAAPPPVPGALGGAGAAAARGPMEQQRPFDYPAAAPAYAMAPYMPHPGAPRGPPRRQAGGRRSAWLVFPPRAEPAASPYQTEACAYFRASARPRAHACAQLPHAPSHCSLQSHPQAHPTRPPYSQPQATCTPDTCPTPEATLAW